MFPPAGGCITTVVLHPRHLNGAKRNKNSESIKYQTKVPQGIKLICINSGLNHGPGSGTPPPPCASTLKVSKTTVTRAHVLRQARACARRAVPKERMSPETCPYLTLSTIVQANFSEFWRSSLPIRAIRSCGIEALSHLAPHLEQLHMLALWGSLWGRLGFRFWNGFRLPIPWDKTVINNIFGEVKLAPKHMAKAPNPPDRMYVTAMPGVAT